MRTVARRLAGLLTDLARALVHGHVPPVSGAVPSVQQLVGQLRRQGNQVTATGRRDLEPLAERLRGLRERLEYARQELGGAGDDPEYRRLAVGVMTLCRQAANLVRDGPDADRLAAAVASARALRSQVERLARGLRTR